MPNTADYYKYATLSTAAYVRMGDGPYTGSDFARLAAAQRGGRLPTALGEYLFNPGQEFPNAAPWTLLDYYGGDISGVQDPSGFGAALFQAGGEKVLAMRGTEPGLDGNVDLLSADLGQIGIFGLALTQVVSMANYVMRLRAAAGDLVPQVRVQATLDEPTSGAYLEVQGITIGTPVFLVFSTPTWGTGLGKLSPGELVKLTGHSLGGHLAVMAARLFPDIFDQNVFVYNSAGYDPTTANLLGMVEAVSPFLAGAGIQYLKSKIADEIGGPANLIGTNGNQLASPTLDLLNGLLRPTAGITQGHPTVIHIQSEDIALGDDVSVVSGALTGADKYGTPIQYSTEFDTHSIEALTDALALQALIAKIDPGFTPSALESILRSASRQDATSEERVTEALFRLIKGWDAQLPRGGDSLATSNASGDFWAGKGDIGAREAFHAAILSMQEALKSAPPSLTFSSLVAMSASELSARAQVANGLAYRYALSDLNPFAVLGPDALYARYLAGGTNSGELDLYQTATHTGSLTSNWITDRSQMLTFRITANTNDTNAFGSNQVTDQVRYTDLLQRPEKTDFVVFLPGGTPNFDGPNTRRIAFGSDRPDSLVGRDNTDRLYGGGGSDYLAGNGSDDYLEGGSGLDIYNYGASTALLTSTNDGNDTILDTDGRGVLRYLYRNGVFATPQSTIIADASVKLNDTTWRSADARFTYTKSGNDLVVTINGDAGGSLRLKDWRPGDFGIRLWQARTAPQFTDTENVVPDGNDDDNTLVGTGGADLILAYGGKDRVTGAGGDDIIDGGTGDDILNGQGGNDRIYGDIGDDQIEGGAGSDELYGGAGRDFIADSDGANLVEGNAGTDIAFAYGTGKDEFYADATVTLDSAISNGEGVGSGSKGDWLMTGVDDDLAVGSAGNDVLMGGGGSDILVGGAGDDNIEGDTGYVATTFDWTATRTVTPQPDGSTLYKLIYDPVVNIDATTGGNDIIYAGSGEDWIRAGVGDDFVNTGSGDDKAWGEAGSDVLIGGLGNDLLVGDNPGFVTGADEGGDYLDGGAGNDTLEGDGGGDVLIGGAGDDILAGGAGKDIYVFAKGDGKDTVFDPDDATPNGPDASVLILGDGISRSDIKFRTGSLAVDIGPTDPNDPNSAHDVLHFAGFDQITPTNTTPIGEIQFGDGTTMTYADILAQGFDIDGTEESDDNHDAAHPQLIGTGVTDRIRGLGGDDIIAGIGGDDTLDGGAGNDFIFGGAGADTLIGGAGIDQLQGGSGSDNLQGGDDADQLFGDADDATDTTYGDDTLDGGAGDDFVAGNAGNDTLYGGDGNDNLQGQTGSDVIDGGAGDDFLYGDGVYFFNGVPLVNLGDDGAADTLSGGDGNDQLDGAGGDDVLDGGAGVDTLIGRQGNDVLHGGADNDVLLGDYTGESAQDGNDTLFGDDGDDQLYGGAGNDMLDGGAGSDTLSGGSGADTLGGGSGDDTLYGEGGDDTYLFNLGDGRDMIIEDSAVNTEVVRFGAGIAQSDLTLSRNLTGDLIVSHSNGTDELTIRGWYAGSGYQITRFEFADGSTLTGTAADALASQRIIGTSGNDVFGGTNGNDTLFGLGGNDTIFGNSGNDVLIGGTGNDTLNGGAGNDTYRFDLGDGQDHLQTGFLDDTLRFGASIAPSAISYRRVGNDLVFSHSNGTDKVTVDGWYGPSTTALSQVVFEADGSTLSYATLTNGGMNVDDVYNYAAGNGAVTIEDWGGNDRLTFAAGIAKANITPSRAGQDLVLTRTSTDKVTVKDWFNDVNKQIETVNFAGTGESFSHAELTDPFLTINGTAVGETLNGGDAYGETINGLAGDDTINGGGGNDLITGGLGNDRLFGGAGNDRYFFKSGDGQDFISEGDGGVLQFGPGMVNNVVFGSLGQDVLITFNGSSDRVQIQRTGFGFVTPKFELNGSNNADTITGSQYGDVIQGLGGNDSINGGDGSDEIYGGAGDDTLEGGGSDTDGSTDYLYGGDGNDILDSGLRSSTGDVGGYMTGGPGNDQLFGSSGLDVYIFNLGDGADTITDESFFGNGQTLYSLYDEVDFGPGITQDSIGARYSGSDLIVQVTPTDSITMKNWTNFPNRIDYLRFADGSSMNDVAMDQLARTISGTSGNDTLTGTTGADTIRGLAGDDTISALDGNDQITGGTGNDVIDGGPGNDRYLFNSGDGQDRITDASGNDTVQFGAGITASGVTLGRSANSLVLTLAGGAGSVTIDNYLIDPAKRVETFQFADGSALPDTASIVDSLVNVRGTAGDDVLTGSSGFDVLLGFDGNDSLSGLADNDQLVGGAGNDTLDGGAGNDLLDGGAGSDTFLFNRGDAQDTVVDTDAGNSTVFGAGILPTDVSVRRAGNNLVLTLSGGTDSQNYVDYFVNYPVSQFRFADGTAWTTDTVKAMALAGTAGDDTLIGYDSDDQINGLAGADVIRGGAGNDIIDGGSGADQLFGEDGDDTLLAGAGDSARAAVSNLLRGGAGNDVLIASDTTLDQLFGDAGNDLSLGGAGNDTMEDTSGSNLFNGKAGADQMRGGDGNDLYAGGAGNDSINGDSDFSGVIGKDIVLFNRNEGADSVSRLGAATALSVGGASSYSQFKLDRVGNALLFKIGKSSVTFTDWYDGTSSASRPAFLQVMAESLRGFNPASTDPTLNRKVQVFDLQGLVAAWDQAQAARQKFSVADNLSLFRISGSDTDAYGGAVAYEYGVTGSLDGLATSTMQSVIGDPAFGQGLQPITGAISGAAAASALGAALDTDGQPSSSIDANQLLYADNPNGHDSLAGGSGSDFLAGRAGNDTLSTGAGNNVISFNAGDGADTVISGAGAANAISLGGGIGYDGLQLAKDGNDLVLKTGQQDSLTLKDWYAGKDDVLTLQIILDATAAFNANSSDPLLNKKVQTFDFRGLVSQFDQARAQSPGLSSWAMTNALLQFHLTGSNDAALGGDLAYWYGKNGSLAGMSIDAAQQVIGAAGFGSDAQALHPFSGLQDGLVRLN